MSASHPTAGYRPDQGAGAEHDPPQYGAPASQQQPDPGVRRADPESNSLAAAAEYQAIGTVRQKLGYGDTFNSYYALTEEIMKAAN